MLIQDIIDMTFEEKMSFFERLEDKCKERYKVLSSQHRNNNFKIGLIKLELEGIKIQLNKVIKRGYTPADLLDLNQRILRFTKVKSIQEAH